MKILLACNGCNSPLLIRKHSDLIADIPHFKTTHMSEINPLLIAHWLSSFGHTVKFLVRSSGHKSGLHFDSIGINSEEAFEFDILLIFKTHGLKLVKDLLQRGSWPKIIAWLDSPNPQGIIGESNAERISTFFWGTPEILRLESRRRLDAIHVLCEHATTFATRPVISESEPRGLYAGRLPLPYLEQVRRVSAVCPVRAYALWIEMGNNRDKMLLRPGQYKESDLEWIRRNAPASLDIRSGTNMPRVAPEASACAFGICPSASVRGHQQLTSASKFYDYIALGLPVLLAANTPEAAHVLENPFLGELYDPSSETELESKVESLIAASTDPGFKLRRKQIQDWCYNHHTYDRRARVIHSCIAS